MVRGPEGTCSERFQRVLLFTGHRTDTGDGQGFLRSQGWEQLRELMGQSALAAARWPDQQEVMPSCSRKGKGSTGLARGVDWLGWQGD